MTDLLNEDVFESHDTHFKINEHNSNLQDLKITTDKI